MNREELAKACGKYLLATRMGSVSEVKEEVLARPGRYRVIAENLHAKEVMVGDGARRRRYILCYNPREAERERKHREQVVKELEEELGRHSDHQATAKWAFDFMATGRYRRYLTVEGENRIGLDRKAIREAKKYDGKWVIQTNDDTITIEDATAGYKGLLVIERCFRALKRTRIKMEPMYHWLPRRIEAHVKLCVFALLIERVAELQCKQPWSRISRTLSSLQVSEFQTPDHQFFQRNEASTELMKTLKSLEILMPKVVLNVSSTTSNM